MALPKQRSDGRYLIWVRVAPGPKGRLPAYGRTPEEAEVAAQQLRDETSGQPLLSFALAGSFAEFLYGTYVPHVYPGLKKTSRRKYDSLIKHHILPAIGKLAISKIGYQEIKKMADGLRRKDKRGPGPGGAGPLPPRQKAEVIYRTREILELYNRLAQAKGERTRDDWRLVEPPPKPRKKRRDAPEDDFTETLLAASAGDWAWTMGPHFAALFLGLRRGEVCGLRWDKIDRRQLTIEISEQHQPEYGDELTDTKGEARTIPVPMALLDKLEALGDHDSIYVFTDRLGRRIKENELSKATPKVCNATGLPATTFHDLRSFAASNLAALGVDPYVIMEILGHTKLDTSMIYINARNDQKRKAIERLLGSLGPVDSYAVTTGCDYRPISVLN